ncbi:MAG: pitrilysin family protein [Flavobacteriales bacterium]|nr:pitrilysin family protein [Flavobacteriales bacterium]
MKMLDRNQEIDFQEIHMPKFLAPKTLRLANSIEVYVMEGGGHELCRLDMVFEAGSKFQNKTLQASMCNAMLFEGTVKKKGEEIHESLDFYGAYTQLDINSDRAVVTLYTLNKYFDKVLPIFIDAIKNAAFSEDEFKVILAQKKQSFIINSEKVEFNARNTFFNTLFDDHPYGCSASIEDFEYISQEDLVNFHDAYYKKAAMKVYVAGMMPKNGEAILNQYLGTWELKKMPSLQKYYAEVKNDKIHIAKDGALQSAIRIGRVCFNSQHKDYHQLKFLSVVLGGYFGSRLMSNIREDKGLTYGIGSICIHQEESGYFSISTEVKGEGTQLALQEIYYELRRLREELISVEELSLVKNYIMGQILNSADGPFAQASLLKNMHVQGVGFEFYDSYQTILDNIDAQALQDLARKYLKEEDLCEIVVGNTSF